MPKIQKKNSLSQFSLRRLLLSVSAFIFILFLILQKKHELFLEHYLGLLFSGYIQSFACSESNGNEYSREALAKIKDFNSKTKKFLLSEMLTILNDKKRDYQHKQAKNVLVQIGDIAVPKLVESLESKNPDVRYFCTLALGEIGNDEVRESIWLLESLLKDNDYQVRLGAAEALNQLDTDVTEAVSVLLLFLNKPSIDYSDYIEEKRLFDVVKVLKKMGPKAKKTIPYLIKILRKYQEKHETYEQKLKVRYLKEIIENISEKPFILEKRRSWDEEK